jgi:GT2 family glycosyltransferase
MIFPGSGSHPINCGAYDKIMWGVGFCWLLNRHAMKDTGLFDTAIGHQNECDYALRLRMEGWLCAAAREVGVVHHATATNDPASIERIGRGVMEFVNKWCRYFGGKNLNYHSPNVLRWEDWPPNALYLEEYWQKKMPNLNDAPEVVTVNGREFDLIKTPKFKDFYRGRII